MFELKKALQQTTSSGQYLLPESLEPMLLEYLARIMPLYSMLGVTQAGAKTHEYTKRTAVPSAWFEGEVTGQNAQASTYVRESVQLKILRAWGGVSGFQQATSQRFIDSLEAELIGSMEGFAQTLEWSILFGNASADAYQFSGIDTFLSSDAVAKTAISSGGNIANVDGVVTLTDLDNMIDAATAARGVDTDPYVFVASKPMISKISGLQTKISRTVQTVEYEGGFRMATYRDIPIYPSSLVRPAGVTTSPTVSASAAAGGSLPDNTYYYGISSVTDAGEQMVGTTASATTATTNNTVALTWTADPNAKLYKIWRGTTSGAADNLSLLTTIAAKTYNADGSVNANVTSFNDTGALTLNTNIKPLTTGEESIFLVNLSRLRGARLVGMVSPLGEQVANFISYVPLATRSSAYEYMIESFSALMLPYPTVHAISRRVKTA